MSSVAKIAFWLAGGIAAASVLLVLYVLGRRLLAFVLHKRVSSQVDEVQKLLAEHEKEHFQSVDRLLFQLGQVDHQQAIEAGLSAALERTDDASRARLRQVYESLGLTRQYLQMLEKAPRWQDRMLAARLLGQLGAIEAVPLLVAAMRDPHEDAATVKLAAAQALGQMQAEEAVPILLQELKDRDDWASPRLAELLVSFGPKARDALHEALNDEAHANARIWAAQILGRCGDASSVPLLLARLSDRSDRIRMSAAEALGRLGDKRAVAELVKCVMGDPVSPVRAEAARALGAIGDSSAVEHLVLLLGNHDYWTRLRAIEAIERIRPDDVSLLEGALDDGEEAVRSRAAVALERIGALGRRIEDLASDDRGKVARASSTLVRAGRAGLLELLQAALEHRNMRVRSRMCGVLGEVGDERVVDSLAALLVDPMWPVRVRAVEAIARLRPPGGTSRLLPLLKDSEETVRVATVDAIKALGVPDSDDEIATIVTLFSEGNAAVRVSVIEAVGERPDEQVDRLLAQGLADSNVEVRLRATRAVAKRGDKRFTEALIQRLGDTETRVRSAAVDGLGRIGSEEALRAVVGSLSTADRDFREALTSVMARLGPEEVMKLAATASVENRLACVWALGKTADPEAIGPLERMGRDKDFSVRAAVAGAVGKLPGQRSEAVLARLAADPNERVRAAAVNGLGRLGAASAIEQLVRSMDDPDPFVRDRVAIALGSIGGSRAVAALDYALNRTEDPKAKAFAFIGYGLLGNEMGFRIALLGLSDPRMQAQIAARLERELPEVRERFRQNLHLDGEESEEQSDPLDRKRLIAHYATELRENQAPDRRLAAISALQAFGLEDQLDLLLGVVRTDPDPRVRRMAIVGLLRHSDHERVPAVMLRALSDPVAEVQVAAAEGLAGFADPAHNEALLRSFTLRNPRLDEAIADALAQANTANVRRFIDQLLGESREDVLRGGAAVLGAIGDPIATGVLRAWLSHPNPAMRRAALEALSKIASTEAREAIVDCIVDTNEEVRLTVVRALGRLPGAAASLAGLVHDPSQRVRVALARLVGENGQVGMVTLAEALAADPDDEVRGAAMSGLLSLGDGAALSCFTEQFERQSIEVQQRLRSLSDDSAPMRALGAVIMTSRQPPARALAVRALKLLSKQPHKLLTAALGDPVAEVRIAAIEAVGYSAEPALQQAMERLLRDPVAEVQQAARKARLSVVGRR